MAVVHLQDLDIEFGAERRGDLGGERGEQVDAQAHIAGLDDGGMAGGGLDLGLVGRGEAGRADDMDEAGLRRQRGEFDGRGRRGEIEHAVDVSEDGEGIVGDGDAERLEASHFADVAADIAGEPLASMPPASAQPGVSASTRASAWPMRPAAPSTAIFMSLMANDHQHT